MELERRNQVESEGHEHDHPHLHDEAPQPVSFSASGNLPAVEAAEVAPPQPSASERAFGAAPRGLPAGAGEGTLNQQTTRVVHGVQIVAPAGTHTAAIERCAEIVQLEIGRNRYAQQRLAAARATIVIIPARTAMTDVAHFSGLAGKQTFDGRDWSSVRGSGGMTASDGSFAIGVAEENLISIGGVQSTYPTGYSIAMHELAHAVEAKGLTPEQEQRLERLYNQQKSQDARDPSTHHDAFTDSYAAKNKREYFAQSTNAFFGRNVGAERVNGTPVANHNTRLWLYKNDPDMYAFLVDVYETNRDADGNRAS